MWGFLGSLAGGAANLLGGLFGQSQQQRINQQNIQAQMYQNTHAIQERVADAQAAGINPLAALGSSFAPGAAQEVGSSSLQQGMSGMGQELSRAAQAMQDATSKSAQLDLELKRAQIDQINADVVGAQLRNSKLATTFAAPGSPPSVPYNWQLGGPSDPRPHRGMPDLYKTYWAGDHPLTLLDPDAQRSVFSGVPGAVTFPEIAGGLLKQNLGNVGERIGDSPYVPRPDVFRSLDLSNPWLWQQ